MWSEPHYRADSFQDDMIKNLRNVAIPGTGIPLSWFCYSKVTVYLFLLVLYPLVALVAAFHAWRTTNASIWKTYSEHLLEPKDWFSYWRLNCRLASYHSLVMGPASPSYIMENKWTFLKAGKTMGVPVSPWLDVARIVVKDKNVEGGMGIHMYKNTTHGGDWIIQESFENSETIAKLLPADAPLSTLRIITASTLGLPEGSSDSSAPSVRSLSCVFRAGRAGASTDHASILFDVDLSTGKILQGTTNAHWYRLGLANALSTTWLSSHDVTNHPDCNCAVSGNRFHDMDSIKQMVESAHRQLLPDVPVAGWDIALTTKGNFLLEVNLSCNFFRGSFNNDAYIEFVSEYFSQLDRIVHSKNWRNGAHRQHPLHEPAGTRKRCSEESESPIHREEPCRVPL